MKFSFEDATKALALLNGALSGVSEATAALDVISAIGKEGRDPTADEWKNMDAAADAAADRLNAGQ